MHVVNTRRQYKDKVYETTLLRRSYREAGKVKNETLANLSHLPPETIAVIRESLAGKTHVVAGADWEIERSLPHGHVAAVWAMARKLGVGALLGPPGPQRDLASRWSWPGSSSRLPSWPPPAGGRRPHWPPISAWPTPRPTTCTRRWTGSAGAGATSSPPSPAVT